VTFAAKPLKKGMLIFPEQSVTFVLKNVLRRENVNGSLLSVITVVKMLKKYRQRFPIIIFVINLVLPLIIIQYPLRGRKGFIMKMIIMEIHIR